MHGMMLCCVLSAYAGLLAGIFLMGLLAAARTPRE